ncbi:hypothetical protein ACWCP9_40065 [Streptomyces eurythermus]
MCRNIDYRQGCLIGPDMCATEADFAAWVVVGRPHARPFRLAPLDGRAWTATEPARLAEAAPSTATSHPDRLVAGGLPAEERKGPHDNQRFGRPARQRPSLHGGLRCLGAEAFTTLADAVELPERMSGARHTPRFRPVPLAEEDRS